MKTEAENLFVDPDEGKALQNPIGGPMVANGPYDSQSELRVGAPLLSKPCGVPVMWRAGSA